jgi:hypothetical protein
VLDPLDPRTFRALRQLPQRSRAQRAVVSDVRLARVRACLEPPRPLRRGLRLLLVQGEGLVGGLDRRRRLDLINYWLNG